MNIQRALRIFGLSVILLAGITISERASAQPGVNISFQTFYDDLSPYGRWVRNPQFGSVWVPDVPSGFQPYSTNGYWEVTEYGNTWVSDYDWGWAPFHYGRWSFDDYVGWFWVPDYEWGPAWVNWRSGGGYYGWAPLGPGVNINVAVNIPSFWWVFVPQRYITSPRWNYYCAPRNRVSHYYNQTVIINNYYRSNNRTYVYGPRRDEIERVTRRDVPIRTIDASPRGRGRVIVAESGRGNQRNDAGFGERGNDRYDNRGRVAESNRTGRDAYPSPGYRNERPDYDRSDRTGNEASRRGIPSNNRYESPSNNDGGNDRFGRDRSPAPDRGGFENRNSERSRPSEPAREQRAPVYTPERNNNRQERRSEAPQMRENRQERSSEPRGNDRGNGGARESQGRGSGGATERSSRSPR